MTRKLFWTDPYQTEIETRIISVNGQKITVEETIFFAFSGGQESDSGTIDGYQVIEAKKIGQDNGTTTDDDVNGTTTDDGDTSTTTEDITAPVITDIYATSTTVTTTNINWTTDEDADSVVWYDIVTPLVISTSTPNISSTDLTMSHSLDVTGLTASTTYYYIVTSADSSENRATGTEESFTTSSE